MHWIKKHSDRTMILLLYSFFATGIAGHIYTPTRDLMLQLTPFTLLLTGLFVLFYSFRDNKRIFAFVAVTWTITFFVEVLGVKTGAVFGQYRYGNSLGLQIMDVPLIIGLNWVILIMASCDFIMQYEDRIFMGAVFAGIMTVCLDLFIEPVAIRLDYWHWSSGMPPMKNYAAWFIITFIIALVYQKLQYRSQSSILKHYFLVQLIFFMTIYIALA
ncbi:MAG: carotenoid biosynthesis protein [bacterium]